MTCLTLFMAIAGGIDWWDVVELLLEIHTAYAIIFIMFVVISVLAVLNVINAMFVQDAMESTRVDIDLRMQGEAEETRQMLARLTNIFQEMDPDAAGVVSEDDFVSLAETGNLNLLLSFLGLHFADSLTLFKLLDADGDGDLAIDEFVMGCMRLKGRSNFINSEVLLREMNKLLKEAVADHKRDLVIVSQNVDQICESLGIAMSSVITTPRHKS